MPAPSSQEIQEIMQKCQQKPETVDSEKKNYAGAGKFYYDI